MNLIQPNSIILNSDAKTQADVFAQLSQLATQLGNVKDDLQFAQALLQREQQSSTGFGSGIAIPHAKSSVVNQPAVIVLRTTQLIDWQAIDDEPVNCFICLMSPENGNNEHISMISKLSRKLIYPEFIDFIKSEQDEQKIYAYLNEILSN